MAALQDVKRGRPIHRKEDCSPFDIGEQRMPSKCKGGYHKGVTLTITPGGGTEENKCLRKFLNDSPFCRSNTV